VTRLRQQPGGAGGTHAQRCICAPHMYTACAATIPTRWANHQAWPEQLAVVVSAHSSHARKAEGGVHGVLPTSMLPYRVTARCHEAQASVKHGSSCSNGHAVLGDGELVAKAARLARYMATLCDTLSRCEFCLVQQQERFIRSWMLGCW
jgi:hypothetical protein